jgi:hypothetical protein
MSGHDRHRASIIACARWESPYIAEWLAYHAALGFDHVYLYCNDDDPTELREALRGLPPTLAARLSFRPYFGQGQQSLMYQDALRFARQQSDWISFLDIDEFLVLRSWSSIPDLLKQLDRDGVDSLHFNWLFYGNNGHKTRPAGSVLRNYTRRSRTVDGHTKHISRAACFEPQRLARAGFPFWHGLTDSAWDGFTRRNVLGDDMGPLLHAFPTAMLAYLDAEARSQAIIEAGYIAHFALKSEEDFRIRVARGLGGNFGGQVKWQRHLDNGESPAILDAMNQERDNVLFDWAAHPA